MLKAIIFDLDNTLVDFFKIKNNAIDSAIDGMIELGLPVPHEKAKKVIFDIYEKKGYEYQEVLNQFIVSVYGKIDYKILAAGIISYRRSKEKYLFPYINAKETLLEISSLGLKLGLVTDAPGREAWSRLYSIGFHNMFDKVITYDDTKNYKPSKVPFNMILDCLQVAPKESIMVGDWPERDLLGASRVGMKTAFAKYGDNFNKKINNADVVLEDISEIIKYIKDQNNI